MNPLLVERIQLVAQQPLVFVAFLALVAASAWRVYVRRTEKFAASLVGLPKKDQLSALQLLALGYPRDLSEAHLKLIGQRNLLAFYVTTLVVMVILAALVVHYWSTSSTEVARRMARIEGQNEDSRAILAHLRDDLDRLLGRAGELGRQMGTLADGRANPAEASAALDRLSRENKRLRSELESARAELASHERKFGVSREPQGGGAISTAIAALGRVDQLLDQIGQLEVQDYELNRVLQEAMKRGDGEETIKALQKEKDRVEARIRAATEELDKKRSEGKEGLNGFKDAYA